MVQMVLSQRPVPKLVTLLASGWTLGKPNDRLVREIDCLNIYFGGTDA